MPALEYLNANSLVSYPLKPRKASIDDALHTIADDWFYDILFVSFSDAIRSVYISKIVKTAEGSLEISFSSVETSGLLGVALIASDLVVNHYKNLSKSFASYSSSSFTVKFVFGPGLVDKPTFTQSYTADEAEIANSAIILNKPQLRTLRFEALEFDINTSDDLITTQVRTYSYPAVPVVKPNHNAQFTLDSLNSGSLYVTRGAGAGLFDPCPVVGEIEDVYTLNLVSPDAKGALFLKPSNCYTANTLTSSAKTLFGLTLSKYENFRTISPTGEDIFKDVVHVGHSITFENFCKPKCPPENLNAFAHYLNRVSDGAQELDSIVSNSIETRGKGSSELKLFTADSFCVPGDDVFARCDLPEDPSTHIQCGDTFIKNYHEGRILQIYYSSLTVRNYTIIEVIDEYRVRLDSIPPPAQQEGLLSFRVLDNGVVSNLNCAILAYNEDAANFSKTYFKVAYATNDCYNADGVYNTNVAVIVSLYNPAPTSAQIKVLFEPTVLTQTTSFKVRTVDSIYTLDTSELVLNCREYASIETVFSIPCATADGNLGITVLERVDSVWIPVGTVYNLPTINGAECPGSIDGNQGGALKYRVTQENWEDFDKTITFPDNISSVSELYGNPPSWLSFSNDPIEDTATLVAVARPTAKESSSYNLYFRSYGAVTTIWQIILNYVASPEIVAPLASRFSAGSPLQLSKEVVYTSDNPVLQVTATNMLPLSQDPPTETDVYHYTISDGSLPEGLTLDTLTGKVIGQLAATVQSGNVSYVLFSAENPTGHTLNPQLIYFEVAVELPPILSLVSPPIGEVYSTNNLVTHTVESPLVSFSVLNGPVFAFTLQGDLPAGLYFDSVSGKITGRVSATSGTDTDLLVFTNNVYGQSNTISFTITYELFDAPEITYPTDDLIIETSVTSETTLSAPLFTITALQAFGSPDNFAEELDDSTRNYYLAAGGPPGFTLDYYTGKFYGKLSASELKTTDTPYTLTYALRLGAYNPVGKDGKTILIKLYSAKAPVILGIEPGFTIPSVKEITYSLSRPLYRFRVLNNPTSFSTEGLPPGLSCSSSGSIVGTVAKTVAAGSYTFTVTAENAEGFSDIVTGSITVPVSIISPINNSEYTAIVYTEALELFSVTACSILSGDSITLSAEGLPNEITFSNGNLIGEFTSSGVYFITLLASSNQYGTASVRVKLSVDLVTYSISGTVTDSLGDPVTDILIVLDEYNYAINDDEGKYTISDLSPGSYNLVATSETHTLIPSFRKVDIGLSSTIGVDFIAQTATRLVKGVILDESFSGVPGVTVSDGTNQVITDSFGVYLLYTSTTATVVITPYSPAYVFDPFSGSLPPGIDYVEGADFGAIASRSTSAPTIISIAEENAELVVSFTAPEDTGGTEITNYEYSVNSGLNWTTISPAQTAGPIVITSGDSGTGIQPLENGKTYSVSVRALNLSGPGAPALTISATPANVAPTPTITRHSVNGTSVSIDFTIPTNTSGLSVTSVEYSFNGGVSYVPLSNAVSPLTVNDLTVGNTYNVKLRALNTKGAGEPSATYSFLMTAPPEPPNIQSVLAQYSQLTVNFDPPEYTGGAAIVNIGYSIDSGSTYTYPDPAIVTSPIVITNLENGTTYRVSLIALNAAGSYSVGSSTVVAIPTELPDPPTDLTAVSVVGGLRINFTPPTNSSVLIENYKYQLNDGAWVPLSPSRVVSPINISNLINGTQYSVKILAVISSGDGEPSAPVLGTPAKPATAPTLTSITPTIDSFEVFFKKSEDLGGSPLESYAYSIDNGRTYIDTPVTDIAPDNGKFTLSGLVTGRQYSITLKARTVAGLGVASNTLSATPSTIPDAPTGLTVIEGDKRATVSFTPPIFTGGVSILNYQYQLDSGGWVANSPASVSTRLNLSPLINGNRYALKLRAVNSVGAGAESSGIFFTPAAPPGAPTILTVVGGDSSLNVTFKTTNANGAPTTAYEYSLDAGKTFTTAQALETSDEGYVFSILALTNGKTYSVSIRGVNRIGSGATSVAKTGKPVGPPAAPTILSAAGSIPQASIDFLAPNVDGGSAITNYAYVATQAGAVDVWVVRQPASTSSPLAIPGLSSGVEYFVKLRAINSSGLGDISTAVSIVSGSPTSPTITSIKGSKGGLRVFFSPPTNIGTSAIVSYSYSIDGGATYSYSPGIESPLFIPDLTNGKSYNVKIRAANSAGPGGASNAAVGTPTTLPSAPLITSVKYS